MSSFGYIEEGGELARLVYAEALYATGDPAAHTVIRDARARILTIASRIADPPRREGYLENIPENARTLRLAREWLDQPSEEPTSHGPTGWP